MELESRFRQFRENTWLTQSQLADLLGVTRQTIHNLQYSNTYINAGYRDRVRAFLQMFNDISGKINKFQREFGIIS